MNIGCGLYLIIYAFAYLRDLVAGSDRHTGLLASGDVEESSPESVPHRLQVHHLILLCRKDTLYRSYMELIKRAPLLKNLLDRTRRKPLRDYIEIYAKGQTLRMGTA
ncbi:hypothetical protein HWV62_32069 [Athelia sp. TMB]|nr:hypothetical protein HWV62_32069 [Athelia sp. TMB]